MFSQVLASFSLVPRTYPCCQLWASHTISWHIGNRFQWFQFVLWRAIHWGLFYRSIFKSADYCLSLLVTFCPPCHSIHTAASSFKGTSFQYWSFITLSRANWFFCSYALFTRFGMIWGIRLTFQTLFWFSMHLPLISTLFFHTFF